MSKKLDYKIKKLEKGPLQRFKNQNAVLKKFGEDGLRLYKAATGKKTAEEIMAELGLEADFVAEVVAWLEDRGMVELAAVEGEEREKPAAAEEEEMPKAAEKKAELAEEEASAQIHKESRLRELVEKEIGGLAPKKEEEDVKGEAQEETESEPEEEEIKPVEEETAENEALEEEITPVEEEASSAKEEEPKLEDESIGPEEEEKSRADEEIKPDEGEEIGLNPIEKMIKEKYGDVGLKVYALIDGQKSAEEIMNETGVSEAKLIEMLEYMEKQGIIKLEHPEAKAAQEAEEDKFAPLAEQMPEGAVKDLNPVEVPAKLPLDLVRSIQIKTQIALKLGEKGNKVFEAIDGKSSDVDISLKLGIPLYEVRDILSFFASNRITATKQLGREDIIHRYGEDCFSVYKKYGREGVLLYELIGKDMSIRQMAKLVTKERSKFAEMFIFVHKVLGVDIPIDKDVIFSQLEERR